MWQEKEYSENCSSECAEMLTNAISMDLLSNSSAVETTNFSDPGNESIENTTGIYTKFSLYSPQTVVTGFGLGIIIFEIIISNVLVIVSVFKYKKLRNAQNAFLVSLSCADIAVAMCVMPFDLSYTLIGKWVFGEYTCKVWLTCHVLCCTASLLNVCAIALDRYWSVCDPINYVRDRTVKHVLEIIFSVWIISIFVSVPPLLGWNDWPDTFTSETPCQLTTGKGYAIYFATGAFFIPLTIMIWTYSKIFKTTMSRIRGKTKSIINILESLNEAGKSSRFPPRSSNSANLQVAFDIESPNTIETKEIFPEHDSQNFLTVPGKKSSRKNHSNNITCNDSIELSSSTTINSTASVKEYMEEKICVSSRNKRKSVQTLVIIIGAFVLCWLPFFTMYIIMAYCESCYLSREGISFITWLGYLNSAFNPIIYTVFNTDFRKKL